MRAYAAWLVAWVLGTAAVAAEPDAATQQVGWWRDLGALDKADALTRRAVRTMPDDVGWHVLRLEVLEEAGMFAWIEAEYGRRTVTDAAREALAVWQFQRSGEGPTPPGPYGARAAARRALAAGDRAAVYALLPRMRAEDAVVLEAEALAADLAVATGGDVKRRRDALLARAAAWSGGDGPLGGLAALWWVREDAKVKRARADALAASDRRIASGGAGAVLEAVVVPLAARDEARVEVARRRLEALRGGAASLEVLMNGILAGPAGFDAWEIPERARWSPAMIEASGRAIARWERPELPWGRPDERRALGIVVSEALEKQGRPAAADQVRASVDGACARTRTAAALLLAGDRAAGRERMMSDLLGCVGSALTVDGQDPAGLDPSSRFDRVADAWESFASAAEAGGWDDQAAVGWGVAARLGPTAERVRAAIRHAGALAVDEHGVPTEDALVEAIEAAAWLRPGTALEGSRAALLRARTTALLRPTPERLASAATPEAACLPTLRSRCQVELAVAHAAAAEAGRPLPAEVPRAIDPGAQRAAVAWREAFDRLWFERRATLVRLVQPTSDLNDVLAAPATLREGSRAPRWATAGWRSEQLAGRTVVLTFWASWCHPCFLELPALDALAEGWAADGLDVVALGVSIDDEAAFRRALGVLDLGRLTLLRDPALARALSVEELPFLAVIGPDGQVVDLHTGWHRDAAVEVDAAVRATAR